MENPEVDLTLALQLQAQFEEELRVSLLKQEAEQNPVLHLKTNNSGTNNKKLNRYGDIDEPFQEKLSVPLTDPTWELIDPNPDIHTLFLTFNNQFFWGRLDTVEVRWSPRMTLCAGVCCYEGRGGLCSVRLSLPLLKLRPRKDLIETLLHEMIHAYLFVTANNKDRDGHGPEFHKHMYRINGLAGTKISVYHSFHDEVDVYRQHIWQCDGPCRQRRPYFGLVKRAMNRAPGPRDPWWQRHQESCGGSYTKIQEPEGYGNKKGKKNTTAIQDKKGMSGNKDIRNFFGGVQGKGKSITGGNAGSSMEKDSSFKGKGKSSPLKENIPHFSNSKAANFQEKSLNVGNSQSSKLNNVHGLGSTATGTVRQVNVNNASRSKVHGFSGSLGNSPAKKKPRLGSQSGDNGGRSGAGGGLAVKSGGGSKTFTVKGKMSNKTQTESINENSSRLVSTPAFHGSGFSLGGPSSGVSRLLSLGGSSNTKNTSSSDSQLKLSHSNKKKTTSSSDSQLKSLPSTSNENNGNDSHEISTNSSNDIRDGFEKCPVCNADILRPLIDAHISDCMGEFDDDDDWEIECGVQAKPSDKTYVPVVNQNEYKQSNKPSEEWDTISVSSDESGDSFGNYKIKPSVSSSSSFPVERLPPEDTYPCPVCNERFSQAKINEHLDTHF